MKKKKKQYILFKNNIILNSVIYFFTFVCISIIISLWLSLLNFRNSYVIVFFSILLTYIAFIKSRPIEIEMPRPVLLASLLMFFLSIYPAVYHTYSVPASADAVHTTIIRILSSNIPDTYAPYSNLKLTYQIGFHLFGKVITDLLFFIPDYTILLFLGGLFSGLQPILIYIFTFYILKNKGQAALASIILLGTKVTFQNMYWGGWTVILAMDLALITLILFIENKKLSYVYFPATFAVHPIGGLMLIIFLGLYSMFHRDNIKKLVYIMPSLFLVIPHTISKNYYTTFTNLFRASTYATENVSFLDFSISTVLWIGIIPFILLITGILHEYKYKNLSKDFYIITVFFVSFILYLVLFVKGFLNADKIMVLITLSVILIGSVSIKKPNLKLFLFIGILCVATFFTSHELANLRLGSKISLDEIEFANEFKKFDSELKNTLFLSPGIGWMAHISNKIPYDAKVGWFLAYSDSSVVMDEGYQELNLKHELWEKIVNGCIDCIKSTNVNYIIINKNFFNYSYSLGDPIFKSKYFEVYPFR